MYRRCIVTEVDAEQHAVRGTFPDRGDVISPWLRVLARGATSLKDFGLPHVGDQLAVLLDEREEEGVVLGALFSQADPVPADVGPTKRVVVFSDGARVSYDDETHALELALPAASTMAVVFGDGASFSYDADSHVAEVAIPAGGALNLCGDASPLALAVATKAELDAVKSALDSHTHQAGALVTGPSGGAPVTGMTGTASSGYSPNEVGSAQVNSA